MVLRLVLAIVLIFMTVNFCRSQERGAPPELNPTPLGGGTFVVPSVIDLGPSGSGAYKESTGGAGKGDEITHQPLVHIKVRVIEVERANGLSVSSILDYVSEQGTSPSLTTGQPLNGPFQNLKGITRFGVPGLANGTSGTGALVNLTSRHINWVASLLATEFNADTITAPQVTTLNGQEVIFQAGQNIPFEFGSSSFQQNLANVQQFKYADVGTYIAVTPNIVNWGKYHEGLGKVDDRYHTMRNPIFSPDDILKLETVLEKLISVPHLASFVSPDYKTDVVHAFADGTISGDEYEALLAQTVVELNNLLESESFDRATLAVELDNSVKLPDGFDENPCLDCNWKPSDCTIDLSIAVRLSAAGTTTVGEVDADGNVVDRNVTSTDNIRNIRNVVQLKSGHGVVIGGLIAMSDVDTVSKVPVIGDIPVVGAAFRSKSTQRVKTETIIFVEAEVLPPFHEPFEGLVKEKTSADFCNGKIHLQYDLCDGPLGCGMHRAGLMGDYLPPPSHGEREFWKEYHKTILHKRKHTISSQLIDTLTK